MNLYLLTRNTDNCFYDYYDSAVVCADDEAEAQSITPAVYFDSECWVSPEQVTVKYLGEADESILPGIVCKSFNAG